MEFLPNMTTRAIIAKRAIDFKIDGRRSVQSMIAEKNSAEKSQLNTSAGFQSQAPTTSVNLYPNKNNTETTEEKSPTEVTAI